MVSKIIFIFATVKRDLPMNNVYVRPENPLRNMAEYMLSIISHFAECKGLNEQQAYRYMKRYGGIKLINDYYRIMHTLSFKDAIDAMTSYMHRQGGAIV